MKTRKPAGIENRLAILRERSGLPAAQLAKMAGVSRQTIYAMEAGTYVPNTAVALRLARALEARVEDLFKLPGEGSAPELPAAEAVLLSGADAPEPGQPVELCRVDRRLVAAAPSPVPWYFPASDAVVSGAAAGGKTRVQIFHPLEQARHRILVAGCDPGISVLARHVQAAGVDLVLAHRNSTQALELLKQGTIHIAGTHLRDEASGESNIPQVSRLFPKRSVAVISFAIWEEGILIARGNPKRDTRHRGPGCARRSRSSTASRARAAAVCWMPAWSAWKSQSGACAAMTGSPRDTWPPRGRCARARPIAPSPRAPPRASSASGFIPLAAERYDLVLRRAHLELPAVQTLFDTLSRSRFRRELEAIGGYDTAQAGRRLL